MRIIVGSEGCGGLFNFFCVRCSEISRLQDVNVTSSSPTLQRLLEERKEFLGIHNHGRLSRDNHDH